MVEGCCTLSWPWLNDNKLLSVRPTELSTYYTSGIISGTR